MDTEFNQSNFFITLLIMLKKRDVLPFSRYEVDPTPLF